MAQEQYVFLEKSKVPSRNQWQQVVDESGFDLQIDEELVPFEQTGFLPCRLLGEESGVETYYQTVSDLDSPNFNEIAAGRDYCISFRWGSSYQECACAMILSYALAQSFDALVSYEGEPPYASLDALRTDTEEILRLAREGDGDEDEEEGEEEE